MEAIGCVSPERALNEQRSAKLTSWEYADFTNVLKKSQIERLAEADEHELVREVQVRYSRSALVSLAFAD